MSSLVFLVPLALLLGGAALTAFLWTLRSGQYEDLEGAAVRILLDDKDDPLGETKAEPITPPLPEKSPFSGRDDR